MSRTWDVGVVGGGPAGLASAIALQLRGLRTVVVDGMRPPIDKACGEGLMPGTVAAMHRLGVHISADRARRFSGICFIENETHAEGDFTEGSGLAVRRTVLHEEMVARAERCGVAFRWGVPVTGFDRDGLTAGSEKLAVKWIVGADGARSRVRRWAGLDVARHHESRYAYRRHYRIAPWSSRMEIHWGREGQAYITALGPAEICVAVVSREPGLRLDAALAQFPELQRRIGSAVPLSAERGATTSMLSLRRVYRGNVALVGDASGSVDAITGEGLGLAFCQAEALADALVLNDLPSYQEAHSRIAARPSLFARLLLLLDRQSWLRRRVLAAMAKGNLFPQVLKVHTSDASARHLLLAGARLGVKLLENLS